MYVLVICSYQTFKFCASLYQPEGQFPLSTKTGGMKSKICKKNVRNYCYTIKNYHKKNVPVFGGVFLPKFFDPNLFLVFARVTTIASGFASNLCCDTKQARRSTARIRIELLFGTFRTMRTSKIKLEMMFFESRFFESRS